MDDDTLSFVMCSEKRQNLLLTLNQRRMTITEYGNLNHMTYSGAYRLFTDLKKFGLITCNDAHRHKIYRISDKGKELLKHIGVIK